MKVIRFIDENLEKVLLIAMLLIMVVVVFAQVIMRFVFHNSLAWSEEVARYLFVWQVWLGASYAAKKSEHMQVDLLRRKLKGNAGIYVAMAADLVSILFCLYLTRLSFVQMQGMYKLHRTATSFNMPIWIAYLAVPSGACLMAIRLIQNLISTAKTLKAGKES